jgi:hypothetical protein
MGKRRVYHAVRASGQAKERGNVRRHIPNEILPEPQESERRKLDLLHTLYGARWEARKPHTSGYNCAGHVWASRRTSILEESAIQMILGDDGCRTLRPGESVVQGDLVLYWNRTTGGQESWLHVGVVSELRREIMTDADMPVIQSGGRVPWILSKWSVFHGEWLHRYNDAPYKWDGVRIEFWTDRP